MADNVRSKRRKPYHINDLYEILVEILCRLPCSKSVIKCKSVCKQWSTLISDPFFIIRFLALRAHVTTTRSSLYGNGTSNFDEEYLRFTNEQTFSIVMRQWRDDTWEGLTIQFMNPTVSPQNISLSQLPCFVTRDLPPLLTILGACNDLVLYQRYNDDHNTYEYYIYNIQTKKWLTIPSILLFTTNLHTGFICNVDYSTSSNMTTPCDAFRFCIALIPHSPKGVTKINARLLSSRTPGQWCDVVLVLPLNCILVPFCELFSFGGKLYIHGCNGFIGFDPFVDVTDSTSNGVIQCQFLPAPTGRFCKVPACIGVFNEKLHMSNYKDNGRYEVWVLSDYENRKWSLKHSIKDQDWIYVGRCIAKHLKDHSIFGDVIGFHPTYSDLIYVLFDRWIVLCNLSTREIERISKIPENYPELCHNKLVFSISLLSWLTPLPTFVNKEVASERRLRPLCNILKKKYS